MRRNVRGFVALAEVRFGLPSPVFEFGSYQVGGQEDMADLRPLFEGKEYVGCDMRPGKGVDRVEDLEALTIPSGTVGTAVCVDTIEHVKRPEKAIAELSRVLRPDGVLVLSSVMDFPIHAHPNDYWRFTPEGFRFLLSGFERSVIGFQGDALQPHTVFGLAFKRPPAGFDEILSRFRAEAAEKLQTGMLPSGPKRAVLGAFAGTVRALGMGRTADSLARVLASDEVTFE